MTTQVAERGKTQQLHGQKRRWVKLRCTIYAVVVAKSSTRPLPESASMKSSDIV